MMKHFVLPTLALIFASCAPTQQPLVMPEEEPWGQRLFFPSEALSQYVCSTYYQKSLKSASSGGKASTIVVDSTAFGYTVMLSKEPRIEFQSSLWGISLACSNGTNQAPFERQGYWAGVAVSLLNGLSGKKSPVISEAVVTPILENGQKLTSIVADAKLTFSNLSDTDKLNLQHMVAFEVKFMMDGTAYTQIIKRGQGGAPLTK